MRKSKYFEEIENTATLANRRPDIHYSRDTSIHNVQLPRSHVSITDDKSQKTALNLRRLIFESEPDLHLFQARSAAINFMSCSNEWIGRKWAKIGNLIADSHCSSSRLISRVVSDWYKSSYYTCYFFGVWVFYFKRFDCDNFETQVKQIPVNNMIPFNEIDLKRSYAKLFF